MEDDLYDNLLKELECPICMNYMSPPIRQCATGHSVCESCRKRLPKCALCQGKFTDSRNISLEGLAVKMRYPCINKNLGCSEKLSYTEREVHELRCSLRGFKCPMEKCNWVGKAEEIAAHWASKKMTSKPYHKSNICHTKIKNESYYVNMVQAYGQMFWFKCKLMKNKLFWAVQLVGNAAEAENYCYEIEVFKPGKVKKRILIGDYCQAIDLENSQLFNEDVCSSLGVDSVSGFVSADQMLIYYLRVYQIQENSELGQAQAQTSTPVKNENPMQKPPFKKHNNKQRDRSKGPSNTNKGGKKGDAKNCDKSGKKNNGNEKSDFFADLVDLTLGNLKL